jgi:hypothetical protein
MSNARRWACAAVTAALFGSAARADETDIVLPPVDVTTIPAVVIPAEDVIVPVADQSPKALPDAGDVKPLTPDPMPATTLIAPTPLVATPCPSPAQCGHGGGWYGGVGLLFLTPYLSNNTAFTVITPPAPPAAGGVPLATGSAQGVPINWNCGEAYQVWAGWVHESGWGVRADYFEFNQGSDQSTFVSRPDPVAPRIVTVADPIPFIPGAAGFGAPTAVLAGAGIGADRLVVSSDLNIRSSDLELTYQWAGDDYLLRLSGGGRWQSLRQGYHAGLRNPGDGITTETQVLNFEQEFSGAGPTVGVFLRHGIGGSGLAAYGSVRGAILAGHLDQHAAFAQDISDPTLAALVGSQQTRTRFDNRDDHVLTFGELELGLEYGMPVGHSRMFVRGSVVGQTYGNAGNATNSLGTLSLLGGQAAVGVNY